jgi:GWxTD domain-containing protein
MKLRFGSLVLLAMLGSVTLLRAQSPQDREGLQRFRDSLEQTADSMGLLRLEQALINQAKSDRNNALLHLRLGFVALRIGDLGSKRRYDDGAGEFEWATDLQPTWPWAWYGLGIAEDRVGDSEISVVQGLQAMFGKDHLSRAANAYARSVQADPSFDRGLVELASTALRQRINVKTALAREALRQASATSAGANPQVLLWRGRVEREVGDIDSALVAFKGYLDNGGHAALGQLEMARTEFLHGSLDGAKPYFAGAVSDDPIAVDGYRGDLALIANDSALAEFNNAEGPRRVAFLKRFWGQRDRAALVKEGDRLREHYRRVYYAKRNFQLVSTNRHYDIVERYRSGSPDFDDRGVIYIRHGEPNQRARSSMPGMQANESWLYNRSSGDLIFHFVAREDVQDYKLVESLFDVLGFNNAIALRGGDSGNNVSGTQVNDLLVTREKFSPVYSRLLGAGLAGSQKYLTEERLIGRRSISAGTRTDTYELAFADKLRLETTVTVAGRDSTSSLMHGAYAIPGSVLTEVPTGQGHLYPVRLRLSVSDRFAVPVALVDTTILYLAKDAVPADRYLVGKLAVPVIPGSLVYRLAVEQGTDKGIILAADTISAGDFSGQRFELSGLVIGTRDANLTWRPTPQDTIYFNPLGRYKRDADMELYYEVYGLQTGVPIKTELLVTKTGGGGFLGLFGSKKPAIRLAYQDASNGTMTRIRRTVALDRLSPGRYVMEVIATDPAGSQRRSQSTFEVKD